MNTNNKNEKDIYAANVEEKPSEYIEYNKMYVNNHIFFFLKKENIK